MINRYITLLMGLVSLLVIYRLWCVPVTTQGHFCPHKETCFVHRMPEDGKILVAYLSQSHWASFKPWLAHWNEEQAFGSIFILNYDGQDISSWKTEVGQLHLKNVHFLVNFDSSPYGFYPIEKSPALYSLNEAWSVTGPVYRFNEI